MDRLYGGVCYAGIDTDPELKYPKGAGRVAFSNQQSYIAAISARFVQLQHGEIDKRVSGRKKKSSVFFCLPSRPPPFFIRLSPPYFLLLLVAFLSAVERWCKVWSFFFLLVFLWIKVKSNLATAVSSQRFTVISAGMLMACIWLRQCVTICECR